MGTTAVAASDPSIREKALAEGEEIIRRGCNAHNVLWFYRDAMEATLSVGDWDGVERYAAALEDYTRPEPLPWSDFFIARGRVFAAYGMSKRDDATMQKLRRLRDEADRVGLNTALPAIEEALAGTP